MNTCFKKILLAVDDSPMAEKVAEKALELARQLNAELAVASVADSKFLMTEGGITPAEVIESIKNDLKKVHDLLINKIFKDFKVWTFVEEGHPHEAILKIGKEWNADMLIVGTHGRTGLAHLLLGSVAEQVIRHSDKPVLVIPAR